MRPAPTLLNIPPKLYKHFALVTVAVTACVAILADGGTQERVEQEIAERQAKSAAVKAEAAKVHNRRTIGGMQDNRASQSGGDYVEAAPAPYTPSNGGGLGGAEPTAVLASTATSPPAPVSRKRRNRPPVMPPGAPVTDSAPGSASADNPPPVPPPGFAVPG